MVGSEARPAASAYDAFISYNAKDLAAVHRLAEMLHAEGFHVFLDDWCLVAGEPWQERQNEALANSPCCLAMCGPHGLGPWQNEEVRLAVAARVSGRSMRVIPVLLPDASDAALEQLDFLDRFTYCDFRGGLDQPRFFTRLCAGIRGEAPGPPQPAVTALPAGQPPPAADYRSAFHAPASGWQRSSAVAAARAAVTTGGAPVVLCGLPGIGKTHVLCDTADAVRAGRTVLALSAGGTTAAEPRYLVEEVNAWLDRTFGRGLTGEELYLHDWPDALAALLARVAAEPLLVLLDDLGTDRAGGTVLRAFAGHPDCLVLATAAEHLVDTADARHVLVPPMSAAEGTDFIAHMAERTNLPVEPEELAGQLPADVLSHPLALRTFLAHTAYVPAALLVPGLPSDVLSARKLVSTAVARLPAVHRKALAYAAVLDRVALADLLAAGMALPPWFTLALSDLVPRCLVVQVAGGVEVPQLVIQALDDEEPSVRRAALHEILAELAGLAADAERDGLASLAGVLAPVALVALETGEWRALRDAVPDRLLDRLNASGFWKEYVLLTKALIEASDRLGDTTDRVRLRVRLSRKIAQLGDTRSAWQLAREGEAVPGAADSTALRAELAGQRAFLSYLQEDDRSTLHELGICIALRGREGDAAGLLIAHKLEGNVHLRRGRYEEAAAAYRTALAAGDGRADARHRLDTEASLAMCEARLGPPEAAARSLERTVSEMRALSLTIDLPRALHGLALVYERLRLPARALELARQAAAEPARDPAVRKAVDRMLWRLENLQQATRSTAGGRTAEGESR
ncbi:toll/interleukin-1 receptor domain-containing protein [Streptomyces endophytica]|uniref:Toll/interleukin-1 receptor domain-containing protein n=1 Tax=Streptomyces endophytica TaxID=2991496 RepID=A0ABY6PH96_9ACTN|nr:toll/interleukin-1 receptor domain-containing protein [Streptomyces endophytica]UZJ33166.1 toll/interleukin-1 receptor domain-containing protein [Streptomyces endophytica]